MGLSADRTILLIIKKSLALYNKGDCKEFGAGELYGYTYTLERSQFIHEKLMWYLANRHVEFSLRDFT